MSSRRRVPALEALESKELLMGFSMNPIRTPIAFDLTGTATGMAQIGRAGEVVNARGRIAPTGLTHVRGTLHVVGKVEWGTLTLESRSSNLQVQVYGTTGGTLHFNINGNTVAAHSAFDFQAVDGGGTLTVQNAPGPKGDTVTLTFKG